jgi:hypothetical protein
MASFNDNSVWVIDPVLEHDGWIQGIPESISTDVGGVVSVGAGDTGRFIVRRALSQECLGGGGYDIAVQ